MPPIKDPDVQAFEAALLRSVDQAVAGEGRVTSPEPIKGQPGRAGMVARKEAVTLYLDVQVLAQWRATGKGWRGRAAQVLTDWIAARAH